MKCLLCTVPVLLSMGCGRSRPLTAHEPAYGVPTGVPVQSAAKNDFADLTGLTYEVSGGFAGITDTLDITEGHIKLMKSRPVSTAEAVFTKADRQQLAAVLDKADFAHLVGDYRQKNLADGLNERLTVVVGTGRGAKVYVVSNYGDRAPASYYKVTAYLRRLEKTRLEPAK